MTSLSKLKDHLDQENPEVIQGPILDCVRLLDKEGEFIFGKVEIVPRKFVHISTDISSIDDILEIIINNPYDENIEMKSDGSARRPFCYLSDATISYIYNNGNGRLS